MTRPLNTENEFMVKKAIATVNTIRETIVQKLSAGTTQAHAHLGRLKQVNEDLVELYAILDAINGTKEEAVSAVDSTEDTQAELPLDEPVVEAPAKRKYTKKEV